MVSVISGPVSFDRDPDPDSYQAIFFIPIPIQGNDTKSTDPDPQHCRTLQ